MKLQSRRCFDELGKAAGLLRLVEEQRSQIGLDSVENVGLDHGELNRLNGVRCSAASIEFECAAGLASFGSYFAGVAMVHVVAQVGSQTIYVGEGDRPRTVQPCADRFAKEEVEIVNQGFVVGQVLRGLADSDQRLRSLVGGLERGPRPFSRREPYLADQPSW